MSTFGSEPAEVAVARKSIPLSARPMQIHWVPDMPIFASEAFLQSVGDEVGWLGGYDGRDDLRCILPYTIVHRSFLRIVRFRTATILLDELSVQEERSFLESAMEYFRGMGAHLVMPASTNAIFRAAPASAASAPYGSYVVDLDQPEETLWSAVSQSHRRKVRQARAAGVEIIESDDLDQVHDLVKTTFDRSRIPFMGLASFEKVVTALDGRVRVLCALHQGAVQGCAVFPFSTYAAYYLYGGSVTDPATGAMHLLHWEAIAAFRSLGVQRYDFVGARIDPDPGSKQEGIATFKARFGGTLHQGLIWKAPIRRYHYAAYGLAARLRTRGDIVDQESRRRPVSA